MYPLSAKIGFSLSYPDSFLNNFLQILNKIKNIWITLHCRQHYKTNQGASVSATLRVRAEHYLGRLLSQETQGGVPIAKCQVKCALASMMRSRESQTE